MLASGMCPVCRIRWVMHCNDDGLAGWCLPELRFKPGSLVRFDLPSFWAVAVEADDRCKWSVQCPVDVRLRHGVTGSVLGFCAVRGNFRAEVIDEPLEARFARQRVYIPVVIPRDGKDRRWIRVIRLVKLWEVVCCLAVVIHNIAQMIKERWV